MVDGMNIPGAMFADDIMLLGDIRSLKAMMKIVEKFAEEFCLEFSAEKSVIIPLNAAPSKRKWTLGKKYYADGHSAPIVIKEVDQSKYLGLIIDRNNYGYTPNAEAVIQKARRAMWSTVNIARNLPNMLAMGARIWEIYAKPRILYGLEIVDCKKTFCQKLERLERQFCRMITQLSQKVPNEMLYAITGIEPIKISIMRQRWRFFLRVMDQPQNRWSRKALNQQLKYGHIWFDGTYPYPPLEMPRGRQQVDREVPLDCQVDFHGTAVTTENLHAARNLWRAMLYRDGTPATYVNTEELQPAIAARESWLQQTEFLALQLGIDVFDNHCRTATKTIGTLLVRSSITKGCNKHTRIYALELGDMWGDEKLHIPQHTHWLRAKLQVLFVDRRTPFTQNDSCVICEDICIETVHHVMWECTDNTIDTKRAMCRHMIPLSMGTIPTTEWTTYLLHSDRTFDERIEISDMLSSMYSIWLASSDDRLREAKSRNFRPPKRKSQAAAEPTAKRPAKQLLT